MISLALYLLFVSSVLALDANQLQAEAVQALTPQSIVVGIAFIIVGIFFTFFGFRFFRPVLFFAGFALFGIIAYIGEINISPLDPNGDDIKRIVYLVIIVVVGLVGGILFAIFWRLGLWAVGLVGGFFLAMFVLTLVPNGIVPENIFRALFIVVIALICSFLVFKFERPTVIISTSVIGAFLTILGVDFFARTQFASAMSMFLSGKNGYSPDARTYGMLAGVAVLAALGMVVQFRFFKGLFNKDKGAANTSNRADNV
jgi:hypothetical protein